MCGGFAKFRVVLLVSVVTGMVLLVAAGGQSAPAFNKLVVVHDIVRGSANVAQGDLPAKACVLDSRFVHNEQVVWRIKILDPVSGAFLDDKALRSVVVKLASSETLTAKYGAHPKQNPTDNFWATSWVIPEGYPSGTLPYTITATSTDGRTSMAVSFDVGLSQLTVLEGAVPTVPQ